MLRCMKCGIIIPGNSLTLDNEKSCRYCGGKSWEEVERCVGCREMYRTGYTGRHTAEPAEGAGGYCLDCLRKHSNDHEMLFDVAKGFGFGKKTVRLNPYIAGQFTADEIDEILLNVLKQENADGSNFIDEYPDAVAEYLKEGRT